MNPADDEINLLLPLAFGFIVLFFGAIFGLLIWLLNRTKVINLSKDSHLFGVLRAAILSIIGVFVLSGVISAAVFVVGLIKSYFTK